MEIKPKFNLGDTLYTIDDMKIIKFEVSAISTFHSKNLSDISYFGENSFKSYNQDKCFLSEDELLEYIRR